MKDKPLDSGDSKLSLDNTDSMLLYLLKFNDTNAVKYNGMWLPKGTLKKLMDSSKQTPNKLSEDK